MLQTPARVSRAVRFSLVGYVMPYPLELTYSSDEPWQVALDFPCEAVLGRRAVRWVIGRELLLAGLRAPCGDGDVRVVPRGARIVLDLRGETGAASLSVRTETLRHFLDETQVLVPLGQEAGHVDWDALVALLQRG